MRPRSFVALEVGESRHVQHLTELPAAKSLTLHLPTAEPIYDWRLDDDLAPADPVALVFSSIPGGRSSRP